MESKEKTKEVEDKEEGEEEEEEEEEEVLPPPPLPALWAYKPEDWDREELRSAYSKYPYHDVPYCDLKFPPDFITVTLLDVNGKEVAPRTIVADRKNEKFVVTSLDNVKEKVPRTTPAVDETFRLIDFPFVNYRYVSTNCRLLCESYVELKDIDTRFIILLSLRRLEQVEFPEDCDILNYFIQPQSPDHALDIINFFQFHIAAYFKKKTEDPNPRKALEHIRPKLCRRCKVKVHWRKYRKTWDEDRIVMLDSEVIAFYREPFADIHKPRDTMWFWLEQYRKTVCKVSRIKSENCIFLHSIFMFVSMTYNEVEGEVVEEAFRSIPKAIPRRTFGEPMNFYQWLLGNYDPETGIISPSHPQVEPVVLEKEQMEMLNTFEKDLNGAMILFQKIRDPAQLIWKHIRPQLEDHLENNTLPKVDDLNLCTDPNNVKGLLETIDIIEKQLFQHVNYNKALAITVFMRTVYLKSGVERLRELMLETPVDLLHKIHTRGNISQTYRPLRQAEASQTPTEEEEEEEEDEEEEEEEEQGLAPFEDFGDDYGQYDPYEEEWEEEDMEEEEERDDL